MSLSRWRKNWRRSSPDIAVPDVAVTTTRAVNAYGIVFGRPLEVWAVAPRSLPSNDPGLPAGKRAFSALTSCSASVPRIVEEFAVEQSQKLEDTAAKSPLCATSL